MDGKEILGLASGVITTLSFVPQVVTVWRRRPEPAIAVSLKMYLFISIGLTGWLTYGILIASIPVMIANALTLVLSLSILGYKLLYG